MEVMFKYLLCRQACAYLSEEVYLRMKIFYPTLSIPLYAPSTAEYDSFKKKKTNCRMPLVSFHLKFRLLCKETCGCPFV